jgi:hypothetical protein
LVLKIVTCTILVLLVIIAVTLVFEAQPIKADEPSAEVVNEQLGLKLTMTLEKTVYSLGEPINVTLTATNISNQTINFAYAAWTFDFLVYNDTSFVYQWSSFRVFPMFIINWPLDIGENITNVLVWPQTCNVTAVSEGIPVSPGTYYIVGQVPSYGLETTPIRVTIARQLSLVSLKTVVGQGYSLPINVTVMNSANSAETFNVTVLSNATVIGTEVNVDVSNGTLTALSFTWNTTGFNLGNYTVNALASSLSASSSIVLTIPGDINGDFKVNLQDLAILANAYGSKPTDAKWNANADVDGNGAIGLSDLVALAQHYGQHYP